MELPHPYAFDTWKEQGRPHCKDCKRPVLLGFSHYCEPKHELVKIKEPDEWPL